MKKQNTVSYNNTAIIFHNNGVGYPTNVNILQCQ